MDTQLTVWLISELDARGWSQRELARRAGLSQGTVSHVIAGQQRPTWNFCAAIAGPLKTPADEVFVLAGLKRRPAAPVEGEREAVGILRGLSEKARAMVMSMLRGLARDEGVEVVPAAVAEGAPRHVLEFEDDAFVPELLEEFAQVPVEWREVAIAELRRVRGFAELPPMRIIGDDIEEADGQERDVASEGA